MEKIEQKSLVTFIQPILEYERGIYRIEIIEDEEEEELGPVN